MRLVISLVRALWFLLANHFGLQGQATPRARRLVLVGRRVELDVYEPRRCRGVLLLVHGLVPSGHKDPAICDVAAAFASAGFRVLVPHLRSLAELEIDPAQSELLEEIIITVCLDRSLCPKGRVALVSGSYPGMICLRAAGNPEIASMIAAVALLGVFADPRRVAERILQSPDVARWTIYKNFLHLYSEATQGLKQAFGLALTDRLLERPLPQLPFHLEQIRPEERRLFYRIENEPSFREELGRNLLLKASAVLESFRLDPVLAGLTAPVFLLHETQDPLAPPEESRDVFLGLVSAGGSGDVLVTEHTPLGSFRLRFGAPREIFQLAGFLGRFFRTVADFSGPGPQNR